VFEQYVPCSVVVSIIHDEWTGRTPKGLGPAELLVNSAASATRLGRVLLRADDHRAVMGLRCLVQQTLLEAIVGPRQHAPSSLVGNLTTAASHNHLAGVEGREQHHVIIIVVHEELDRLAMDFVHQPTNFAKDTQVCLLKLVSLRAVCPGSSRHELVGCVTETPQLVVVLGADLNDVAVGVVDRLECAHAGVDGTYFSIGGLIP